MATTAQNRAIRNYRSRLRSQGVARFEILALNSDRELIRSLARRLALNDPQADQIRLQVRQVIAGQPARKGGILAALRRSPLVTSGLHIVRSRESARKVDL